MSSPISHAATCPDPGLSEPASAGGPDIALAERACPGWTRATVVFHDDAGHICGYGVCERPGGDGTVPTVRFSSSPLAVQFLSPSPRLAGG
jgi:hypothetical protein